MWDSLDVTEYSEVSVKPPACFKVGTCEITRLLPEFKWIGEIYCQTILNDGLTVYSIQFFNNSGYLL
jgi:hypothetical protein